MSYEAQHQAENWKARVERGILTSAKPYSNYAGFTIVKLEGNPPKFYAEKGKFKTVLRQHIWQVHRDILAMKA